MTPAIDDEKALGKARLEALSDGVFAIAMTLLVLDIKLPDISRREPGRIVEAFRTLGPAFLSFALTFVLAGAFWYLHHVTFHNTRYITRGLAMINVIFLMFVSLLPFSTSVLPRLGLGNSIGQAVYFANQLALGAVLNVIWWFAGKHKLLVTPIADPQARFMIGLQPFCYAAAIVMAFVYPPVSYWVFFLGMVAGRRIASRRFAALPADAPAPL
jgi:uncharacterized membrane protein